MELSVVEGTLVSGQKLRYCQTLVQRWEKAQTSSIWEEASNIKMKCIVIIKYKHLTHERIDGNIWGMIYGVVWL